MSRDEEARWASFHHVAPTTEQVRKQITAQHTFLNFDDDAFTPDSGLREDLAARFPEPCRYESQVPETYLSRTASR